MKITKILFAMACAATAHAATIGFNACPNVGLDLAGCQLLISVTQVNSSGVATAFYTTQNTSVIPSSLGPYDGSDDTLIGIQNDSDPVLYPTPLISIVLTGFLGSNIAGFESDGACSGNFSVNPTPLQCGGAYSSANPASYQSALVTFTNFSTASTAGTFDSVTVNFGGGGLRAGTSSSTCGSAWFSLEEKLSPDSFGAGGTPGNNCVSSGPAGTPEPASLDLLASGLIGLVLIARRFRA